MTLSFSQSSGRPQPAGQVVQESSERVVSTWGIVLGRPQRRPTTSREPQPPLTKAFPDLRGTIEPLKAGDLAPVIFGKLEGGIGGVFVTPKLGQLRIAKAGGNVTIDFYCPLGVGTINTGQTIEPYIEDQEQTVTAEYYLANATACPFTPGQSGLSADEQEAAPEFYGDATGDYAGTFALKTRQVRDDASPGALNVSKVHIYCEEGQDVDLAAGGSDASNRLGDLLYHLSTVTKTIDPDRIDTASFTAANDFLAAESLFFNGVVEQPSNLNEYIDTVAPYFFLLPFREGGEVSLLPRYPIDGSDNFDTSAIVPVATITSDEVINYRRDFTDAADKLPYALLLTYIKTTPGEPPRPATVGPLRFPGDPVTGTPIREENLTGFCWDETQAEKIGREIMARDRWIDHGIRFETRDQAPSLVGGAFFQFDYSHTDELGGTVSYSNIYQVTGRAQYPDGRISARADEVPLLGDGSSRILDQLLNGLTDPPTADIGDLTMAGTHSLFDDGLGNLFVYVNDGETFNNTFDHTGAVTDETYTITPRLGQACLFTPRRM